MFVSCFQTEKNREDRHQAGDLLNLKKILYLDLVIGKQAGNVQPGYAPKNMYRYPPDPPKVFVNSTF